MTARVPPFAAMSAAVCVGLRIIAGCGAAPVAAPAPPPRAAATVAIADVALAVAAPETVDSAPPAPPLVPLADPLDGAWEFSESCSGAVTTYVLTIVGPRGELVTIGPDGTRSQPVELLAAPRQGGAAVGALVIPAGERDKPLFRLVRSEHVLSRYSLGDFPSPLSMASSTSEGSFAPRCTTFSSFIERDEVARQGWTRITLGALSLAYPAKVLRPPARGPRSLDFSAPAVWGTTMAGQRASFALHLSLVKASPSAILSKIIPSVSHEVDAAGPMIAGKRGADIQMGIEGVGQHYVAVPLDAVTTLSVRIDWVSSFANEKITLSDDMQLAIADRILASIEEKPVK